MQKIILVAHCLLNPASKVDMFNCDSIQEEEKLRKHLLTEILDKDFHLIQLPCPELILYGAKRWGHTSEQFDTPFFRAQCRKMLLPIIDQLLIYTAQPESFEIIGILGIDGSPSCGVDYTSTGNWGGNLVGHPSLFETVASASLKASSGIFIEELLLLLREHQLPIPVRGLFTSEPHKCFDLLKE